MNLTKKHESVATVTDRYCFSCISKTKEGFENAFNAWKAKGCNLTPANRVTILQSLEKDSINPITDFEMIPSTYKENPFED